MEMEVDDVEARRLFAWCVFSIAFSTSDLRKARNRERLYVGSYVCVKAPLGGLVLAAWLSDWTEYIQITHCPGMWPGTTKSGSIGGGVDMYGTHHELSILMAGWLWRPQGCCSRVSEAR